jgi:hypothetical protein
VRYSYDRRAYSTLSLNDQIGQAQETWIFDLSGALKKVLQQHGISGIVDKFKVGGRTTAVELAGQDPQGVRIGAAFQVVPFKAMVGGVLTVIVGGRGQDIRVGPSKMTVDAVAALLDRNLPV